MNSERMQAGHKDFSKVWTHHVYKTYPIIGTMMYAFCIYAVVLNGWRDRSKWKVRDAVTSFVNTF